MRIAFHALPTETVAAIRQGGRDSYGMEVERHLSDGKAYPCRLCLGATPEGQTYLILAHRPFSQMQPYAETGPIFLCASACKRAPESDEVPGMLKSPTYLLRGYDADERIIYGTGGVVATASIAERARDLLSDERVAFVDVRSAANNCFQCRVKRA